MTHTHEEAAAAPKPANAIAQFWANRSKWIHGRSEKYEFSREDTLRRSVIIELSVATEMPLLEIAPEEERVRIIPVMRLQKGILSGRLRIRDSMGATRLSYLEYRNSRSFDWSILHEYVTLITGRHADDELKGILNAIVGRSPEHTGEQAWMAIKNRPEFENRLEGANADQFRYWVRFFSGWSLLYVAVPESAPNSLTIEIDHEISHKWEDGLAARLGWGPWICRFPTNSDDSEHYRFELQVPEGVDICSMIFTSRPEVDPAERKAVPVADKLVRRHSAHLTCHRATYGRSYLAFLELRPARGGWLTAAMASAIAIISLLYFTAIFSGLFTKRDPLERHPVTDLVFLMATLFLASGAAIIAILVRSDEHQLTSQMLALLRAGMAILNMLAFAAVLVLVSVRDQNLLWLWFISLAGLATPLGTCIAAAWCSTWRASRDL